MHIADGLISPQTYLPAAAVVIPLWFIAGRRLKHHSDYLLPRLAVFTALALILNTLMLPLPGGTTGHLVGISILALIFGPSTAFIAYSLMLFLQTLVLGAGGITALPINALAIGFVGAWTTGLIYQLGYRIHPGFAISIATFAAVMISATLVALALGIQPIIAAAPDGTPRFFPFGLSITLPAILIPHFFIALGEALLTTIIVGHAQRRQWVEAYSS